VGWRGTLGLAVLTALAAALYLASGPEPLHLPKTTLMGEPRYIDPNKPVTHLLDFDAGRVVKIVFGRGDEEVTVTREAGRWHGAANPKPLDDFLSTLADLQKLTTIDANARDLADYGLTIPSRRLGLETSDGGRLSLAIGDRNPPGTAVYVQIGAGGPVALAGALIIWEFDKAFAAVTGRPSPI
jgi:Domain of unknown function (DUF4340)